MKQDSDNFEFSTTLPHSSLPADELFYKGQLLPLHLSPRLSLLRSLLLSSPSSSDARDSNGSSSSAFSSESSLPSCETEDVSATKRRHFFSFLLNRKKNPTFNAKGMIKKYVEKVRPLYGKLFFPQQKASKQERKKTFSFRAIRTKSVASCPTSMRSSPSHSGLLCSEFMSGSSSSMEELQSAIQAAIAHCKSTMALHAEEQCYG